MISGLKARLGKGYKMFVMVYKDDKLSFYRSASDEAEFAKYYGEKCLGDESYLNNVIDKLHELTDSVGVFLKRQSGFNKGNYQEFFDLFEEHFAYHMVNFWAGDYVAATYGEDDPRCIRLYESRKYNERVLPDIENWIRKQEYFSFMMTQEVKDFFADGREVDHSELEKRKEISFVLCDLDTYYISSGEKAQKDYVELDALISSKHNKFVGENGEVTGTPVFKGKYVGKVRVIDDFSKFGTIQPGEVLITPMTRPHFNDYIKKAGAIVTDEGAMLCHAAIVAREFKIPTIVGTKVATFTLKTGDMVEVDANEGIVRKI
jgi:pyruvate,water dikinase